MPHHWVILYFLIKLSSANISWGSYSYKYLSAVLHVSEEEINISNIEETQALENEGAYGYSSSYNSISGQIFQPDPSYGCPPPPDVGQLNTDDSEHPTYNIPQDFEGTWIALIERGDCLFSDKINLAFNQTPPAVGAIIYNEGSSSIVPMEYISPDPDFVAVMIDRAGYDELMSNFNVGDDMFVYISPGSPQVSNSFERIVIATVSNAC